MISASRGKGHSHLVDQSVTELQQHSVTDLIFSDWHLNGLLDSCARQRHSSLSNSQGRASQPWGAAMLRKGDTSLLAALRGLMQAGLRLWHAPAVGVCINPRVEGGNVHGDPAIRPHCFKSKHLCAEHFSVTSQGNTGCNCNVDFNSRCGYQKKAINR